MEKEWFRIEELALRWGLSLDDIELYLQSGALKAVVWLREDMLLFRGGDRVRERGLFKILNYESIVWVQGGVSRGDFLRETVRLERNNIEYIFAVGKDVCKRDILVTLDEVRRFETQSKLKHIEIAPYLDRNHPFFSKELEAAVSAWEAVYLVPLNTKRSQKALISQWLEQNRKKDYDLSAEALDRIAKVVNANKKGGAPPSE